MPTSIIKVYDSRRGEWAECIKVQLQWNGFVNLGVSDTVYTDRSGKAIIPPRFVSARTETKKQTE